MLAWRNFLRSQTGIDLIQKARARECSLAILACRNSHECEPLRAAGFSDAVNWFMSLAVIERKQSQNDFEPRYQGDDVPGIVDALLQH